ncbi:MAG: helix-turn-helix transcriptional regulator [Oscillospiraceae bacterium]|nr:helix-turn-helix transcriptional regulator [Oscillospiraceae bacterium]
MDKELLIFNIRKYCAARNLKPTIACTAAGVGRSFVSDIARGKMPSVAKVADLAAYLGVSVSDLVGDAKMPADLAPLAAAWAELSGEGRARLIEYAEDLVAGGRYIKNHLSKEA